MPGRPAGPDPAQIAQKAGVALREVFRLEAFRPGQLEAIQSLCGGRDTVAIFPTGAGKSLIYQLSALVLGRVCFVVTPLLALMNAQVAALRALGVPSLTMSSSAAMNSRASAYGKLRSSPESVRLVYVTPESCAKQEFQALLRGLAAAGRLGFFAIDECHVLSDWGNSFRRSYRGLHVLRRACPGVPIIALTATATGETLRDIATCLRLERPNVVLRPFNRENIYYQVWTRTTEEQTKIGQLVSYLERFCSSPRILSESTGLPGAVIVYCNTRAETESVSARLARGGYNVHPFHAGLDEDFRNSLLDDWMAKPVAGEPGPGPVRPEDVQIMVATVAFGMGIDRPDVRLVVHFSVPSNMEGFYQESGRAGRDGDQAYSLVLLSYEDIQNMVSRVSGATEAERHSYYCFLDMCLSGQCIRRALLSYFNSGCEEAALLAPGGRREGGHCCDSCDGRRMARGELFHQLSVEISQMLRDRRRERGRESLRDLTREGALGAWGEGIGGVGGVGSAEGAEAEAASSAGGAGTAEGAGGADCAEGTEASAPAPTRPAAPAAVSTLEPREAPGAPGPAAPVDRLVEGLPLVKYAVVCRNILRKRIHNVPEDRFSRGYQAIYQHVFKRFRTQDSCNAAYKQLAVFLKSGSSGYVTREFLLTYLLDLAE